MCFQPNRREAGKSLAALQDRAMVKRIAPIRVISFCLLAACGALCQSETPSADLLQRDGSNSPEVQRQNLHTPELHTWRSLPDAPSVQLPTQSGKFRTFVNEARSPLTLGAAGVNAGAMRGTELRHVTPGPQPSLTALYKENLRYHPSTSSSLMGRATDAASRILSRVTAPERGG